MILPKCRLVFGTMTVAGTFDGFVVHRRLPGEMELILNLALNHGFEWFDTAPIYGMGLAESALGDLLQGNSNIKITTKVGVEIQGPIPKLDYSLEGMKKSIEGSLNRLKRQSVHTVLVHNPGISVVKGDNIYLFADWVRRNKLAQFVGVSLLDPYHLRYIVNPELVSMVMIESFYAEAKKRTVDRASKKHFLMMRSPLVGGRLLHTMKKQSVMDDFIKQRISYLIDAFNPICMVVGPNKPEQFRAYESFF